jgi:hypothetical protein
LGFSNFIDDETGQGPAGLSDIYSFFIFDNTQNTTWSNMTPAERAASAINSGNVVWNGPNVTAKAPAILDAAGEVAVNSPGSIAGNYLAQPATFGPALNTTGVSGNVVLAEDGVGATNDGCEPLTNGGAVAGNIALIDRGTCAFITKVANAQAAGATGVIIANNNPVGLPPMGGADPTIGIPSVGISLADGNTIKSELPGVNATLRISSTRLAGSDSNGNVLLYTPNPVEPGSTISHWDTSNTPNLLMEPFINFDLAATQTLDLTPYLMTDIGWMLNDSDGDGVPDIEDSCPDSDTNATVVIDGCDSGVANVLVGAGCTISDLIEECAAGAGNHGGFVSCVSHLANDLKKAGIISGRDKGKITSCAAQSNIP